MQNGIPYPVRFYTVFFVLHLCTFCTVDLNNQGDPNSDSFWKARLLECILTAPNCGRGFELLALSPIDGSQGVPAGIPIRATYSSLVNTSTFTMQSENGPCTGNFQLSKDNFASCLGGTIDASKNPTIEVYPNPGNVCVSNTGFKIKMLGDISGLNGSKQGKEVLYTRGYDTGEPKLVDSPAAITSLRQIELFCNQLFIAGNFKGIGYFEPFLSILPKTGLNRGQTTVVPNSSVYTIAPDPNGGLWIGGNFTSITDKGVSSTRTYIAKVLPDGSLSPISFTVDAAINKLLVVGSKLLVGGNFTTFGGFARNRLAEIDLNSNTVTSWAPNPNQSVVDIQIFNNQIYVLLGALATCGANTHNSGLVCRLNLGSSNADTSFAATDYNNVEIPKSFVVTNFGVFVAADDQFNTNYGIGKYNLSNGTLDLSFNPFQSGFSAQALAISGNVLYASGNFTTAFGQNRTNFFAYDLSSSTLLSDDPFIRSNQLGGSTLADSLLIKDGQLLFLGANLTYVKSDNTAVFSFLKYDIQNRRIDESTSINANGRIYDLISTDTSFIIVGDFLYPRLHPTLNFGAIDISTGIADPNVTVNLSSELYSLLRVDNRVFFGGGFQKVNGETKPMLAAWNIKERKLDPWNGNFAITGSNFVTGLYQADGQLYAGGNFATVGGETHTNVVKFNLETAKVDSLFTATANTNVRSFFKTTNNELYISGDFTNLNGLGDRAYLGVVNPSTGVALSQVYTINQPVYGIKAGPDQKLFVFGNYTNILGSARNGLASITVGTTTLRTTNIPITTGPSLYGFLVDGQDIYFGGTSITTVNGNTRANFAHVTVRSDDTFVVNPLTLNANGEVRSIQKSGSYLFLGGVFTTINGSFARGVYMHKLSQ
ncbi:two-component regulator propeller domain-containing protein [Leptospira ryugenii]|uniref:two-component regulator propeller domain-containing protein n=1 Tax=Leptospira ryugenii TaxID=1917863 RepID=UPI001AE9C77E|nr:two-component regulator propeller domain-containing protein [Leptospira ryugenii]